MGTRNQQHVPSTVILVAQRAVGIPPKKLDSELYHDLTSGLSLTDRRAERHRAQRNRGDVEVGVRNRAQPHGDLVQPAATAGHQRLLPRRTTKS